MSWRALLAFLLTTGLTSGLLVGAHSLAGLDGQDAEGSPSGATATRRVTLAVAGAT